MTKFIAYYRQSTEGQRLSGLGVEAQKEAVAVFIKSEDGEILEAFEETESGKVNDRPALKAAFDLADVTGATVVFAKLDRLSRNAAFLLNLKDSGVKFVALDCPKIETLDLGMRAIFAQHEREAISARTKAALQAAKKRLAKEGRRLGNPNGLSLRAASRGRVAGAKAMKVGANAFAAKLAPYVATIIAKGDGSLSNIAAALNGKGMPTPRGAKWDAKAVSRLLARIPAHA